MTGMARRILLPVLLILLALGVGFALGRTTAIPSDGTARASSADFVGPLRVIDGDTFDVGDQRVRLHGVDAPENAQTCLDPEGQPWPCGDWATEEARALWEGRSAACVVIDTDRYGRAVSRCAVDGEDLGAAMVERGMALAYVEYSDDYLPQQARAEAAGAGLWQGEFQAPWDWRRAPELDITDVVVLSAPEADCRIKGNVSGNRRIYHLPGGPSYERTVIDESQGERWFCTPEEAEAAGWRAAGG